jgi:hypothetical protein
MISKARQMSRQRVALLFVVYFIVSVAIPVVIAALAMPSVVSISRMTGFIVGAIALGIKIYFVSGALPFAVWGARGFKAANARSLFIPWAILILLAFVTPISWFVR